MADELDLDLETTVEDEENKVEKRIKGLSEKVKTTAQERDAMAKAKEEAEAKTAVAQKDAEFYKNYSQVTAKYPSAHEYQEKIREKVMAGYELEDATISILAKEGKLTASQTPPAPKENPAGGSAVNQIKSSEPRPVSEMSKEEKLAALKEAEKRGDIGLS